MKSVGEPDQEEDLKKSASPRTTIGNNYSINVLMFMLGFGPGSVCASYFTSVGYYTERFGNGAFFGYQLLVIFSVQFLTSLIQSRVDDYYDKLHSAAVSYSCRIAVTGFALIALSMLMPFLATPAAVLVVGGAIAFCTTAKVSNAAQLAAVIAAGGSSFVQTGYVMGFVVPIIAAPATGFGPGATAATALAFYCVSSFFVLIGTVPFLCIHFGTKLETTRERSAGAYGHMSAVMETAYNEISLAATEASTPLLSVQSEQSNWAAIVPMIGIFVIAVSGVLPLPLSTLVSPALAQNLLLAKFGGDTVGRTLGLWQVVKSCEHGRVDTSLRNSCLASIFIRCCLTALIMCWICGVGLHAVGVRTVLAMIVLTSLLGAYPWCVLDVDSQLVLPSSRKSIARANLLLTFMGQLVGVVISMWLLRKQESKL